VKQILLVVWLIIEYIIQLHNWLNFLERRYSLKTTLIADLLFTGCMIIITVILKNAVPFKTIIIFFMVYGMIGVLFRDKWYKKLCVHLGYFMCIVLAETLAIFISKYIYGIETFDPNENSVQNLLWQITVYILIIVFNFLFTTFFRKNKISEKTDIISPVVLFVGFQSFVFTCIISMVIQSKQLDVIILWILVIVFGYSAGAVVVIYRLIKSTTEKMVEAEYIKKESEIKDKHFSELREQYVEYRKPRHDFSNHLRIIRELKDAQSIAQYAEEMDMNLEKSKPKSYCDNLTLDALLSLKHREAEQKSIKTNYTVCNLADVGIKDFDLCTVVANLLDNAIEAAEKTDEKHIDLKIGIKMGRLVITVRNSSPAVGESLDTTKQDSHNHGIGIDSIRTTAEKYDGDYAYKFENSEFVAVVNMAFEKSLN